MRQPEKLYPAGRLLWALRDSDLCPAHRSEDSGAGPDKLRLFEVMDREKVFSQILFAKDMLRFVPPCLVSLVFWYIDVFAAPICHISTTACCMTCCDWFFRRTYLSFCLFELFLDA